MNNDNRAFIPCPTCGNDDVETLVWDELYGWDGFVKCLACGTIFNPMSGELQRAS
jgi:uncharacterized Zn finger protein